ncbi:MAG: hypothetical protein JSR15_08065 [Proteobacteria bacterium]|nr:hypothetical protein [Pseudomonadota bacterium]
MQFGRNGTLAGVLTTAAVDAPARPLLLVPRSARMQDSAARRLVVELARAAAARGLNSLRFDLGGCGDSGDRLAGESADAADTNDIFDAMDLLSSTDADRRFMLLGVGADIDTLQRIAMDDARIVGLISINGPAFRTWGYWLRRCAQAPRFARRGPRDAHEAGAAAATGSLGRDRNAFAGAVQALADRGVRTLHVYPGAGGGPPFNHARQFWSMLPPLRTHGRLAVAYLPAADQHFSCRDDREQLFDLCVDWMLR